MTALVRPDTGLSEAAVPKSKASGLLRVFGRAEWIACAGMAIVFLLQIELAWNRPVNWDEFFHLSEAHAFARGELHDVFQVLYARTFFWLAWLDIDAVDQVRIARIFMLALELGTCCAIFGIGRKFGMDQTGNLAVLAYLSVGNVLQHGMSFRADAMDTAFLMGTLYMLVCCRKDFPQAAMAATLTALAIVCTIKVVLFAPVFLAAAIWLWREQDDHRPLIRFAVMYGVLTAAITGALFLIIHATLPEASAVRDLPSRQIASSATMNFDLGLFPRWPYLVMAIAGGPVLFVAALITVVPRPAKDLPKGHYLLSLLFIGVIGCVAVYSNAFPYFYAFILAPVAIGAATGLVWLARRYGTAMLVGTMVLQAAVSTAMTPREVLPVQKQFLATIHDVFPQPVKYFDFPAMVLEFRKANVFMTIWGMRRYRAGIERTMTEIAARDVVPLLIVNQETLHRNQFTADGAWELTPEDRNVLAKSFIPHWGPIWVAGRTFDVAMARSTFPIHAPGEYTLEGAAAMINGQAYAAGAVITLERGNHVFARTGNGEVRLRWGRNLTRPSSKPPVVPVLEDF